MNRTSMIILTCIMLVGAFSELGINLSFAGYLSGDGVDVGAEGGAETMLYKNDTIVMENTITDNAEISIVPETALGIGLQPSAFYSKNLQIYYLPLAYTFNEIYSLSLSIPYVYRKIKFGGKSYSSNGVGDTRLGFAYLLKIDENLSGVTNFKITVPTGDEEAEDTGVYVPLGNGGYSFSVMQSFSQMLEQYRIRVLGNVGLVYFFKSEYKKGNTEYDEEKGSVCSAMLGAEYGLNEMTAFVLKSNFVMVFEGRRKASGGTWSDSNDSLMASDIIGGLRFKIIKNIIDAYILVILPVYTKYDSDISDTESRKIGINLGISGLF